MNLCSKRIITTIILLSIILNLFIFNSFCAFAAADSTEDNNVVTLALSKSYKSYLDGNKNEKIADKTIIINASDYSSSSYVPEIKLNYAGMQGKSILTGEDGYVEWKVNVEESGFYNLGVNYYPTPGKSSTMVREIYIDGELPYSEARNINFNRVWADKVDKNGKAIVRDFKGNDMRPSEIEEPVWVYTPVRDSIGYINEPLKFFLSSGTHFIRFNAVKEPMLLKELKLYFENSPITYKALKQEYIKNGYKTVEGEGVKIQAENTTYKSDPTLIPSFDRSSPSTEPNDSAKLRLNCIGGDKWNQSGQWIIWEFTVPKTGLYKIGLKTIQNIVNGAFSSRRIYIDGKVPFKELEIVDFKYTSDWQMNTLGGKDDPYEFYFEAGKKHQIKMEAILGNMADALEQVMDITSQLNNIYRKILIVTGPNPDVNRDYQFDKTMPEVIGNMTLQASRLNEVCNKIIKKTGYNGENIQIIKKLYKQITEMVKKPETIANRFISFQTNISSLGTWLMTSKQQPLSMDYIMIAPTHMKLPSANASFFEGLEFQIGSFIASFFEDYNSISAVTKNNSVKVWVGNGLTGGRDQAQVIKTMADNYFTPKTNISVNLQLISMGALLPATLAGKGPDVALTLGASDPVNFAVRHAVIDFTQFEDYNEISKRFSQSALIPLSFGKGVYGIPESQTFPMLFYRKDIMAELKLRIPQTWEDVIEILPVLQKKQMNFGLPSVGGAGVGSMLPAYAMLLYQNGGQFYGDDGKTSALNSGVAIDTFSFFTRLYKDYKIPMEYDFLNRFRLGSVPIGIADYSLYNQLSVFAPELDGIWDFTLVPGTKKSDGTIDRSTIGNVNATIILSKSKVQKQSWEFVKWWTSTDIQVKFGRELESIMGTAARYPTANMEALYQIPWSKSSFNKLMDQWKSVKGLPEVPGGYYTPRYVDFAFRDVVNSGLDTGDCLISAAKTIDREIIIKRKEFGLAD